jgi:hypothetical protein
MDSSVWVKIKDENNSAMLSPNFDKRLWTPEGIRGVTITGRRTAPTTPHNDRGGRFRAILLDLKPWLIEAAKRPAAPASVTVEDENSLQTLCHGYARSSHHLRVWAFWVRRRERVEGMCSGEECVPGEEGGARRGKGHT